MKLNSAFSDAFQNINGTLHFKFFIDGAWTVSQSQAYFDVNNPKTKELIAKVPQINQKDIQLAIQSAYENEQSIHLLPITDRFDIISRACFLIEKYKEDFIRVLTLETGKSFEEAENEVRKTIDEMKSVMKDVMKIFEEYVNRNYSNNHDDKIPFSILESAGVIAAMGVQENPLLNGASKITFALLIGNALVIKAAPETPLSLILFTKILEMANTPKGTINLITGLGKNIDHTLISDARILMMNVTRSTQEDIKQLT